MASAELGGSSLVMSTAATPANRKRSTSVDEIEGAAVVVKRPRFSPREVTFEEFMEQLYLQLGPSLSVVVKENVQELQANYPHSFLRQSSHNIRAIFNYRLYFQNKLPSELFTFKDIEAEGKVPLKIAIKDVNSDETVRSGPYSSVMVEVVVLDAHFDGSHLDWTNDDFVAHVVSERDDKEPLLKGKLRIELSSGECILEALFTDHSSWTRSGKFRLGAMVYPGRWTGERIQEAISEPFKVKVRRVAANQKHDTPQLNDKVWRLRNISKTGKYCAKLNQCGIDTVRDFLRALVMRPETLRKLLDTLPDKKWVDMCNHALRYIADNKLYSYHTTEGYIVLNSIYELVGAEFYGCGYQLLDDLDPSQKVLANYYKQQAYDSLEDIVEFNDTHYDRDHWPITRKEVTSTLVSCSLNTPPVGFATKSHDVQGAYMSVDDQRSPYNELPSDPFQPCIFVVENQCATQQNSDMSKDFFEFEGPSFANIGHHPAAVGDEGLEHLVASCEELIVNSPNLQPADEMMNSSTSSKPDDGALSSPRKLTKLSSVMLVIITCIMLRKCYGANNYPTIDESHISNVLENEFSSNFAGNDDFDLMNDLDTEWLLEFLSKSS